MPRPRKHHVRKIWHPDVLEMQRRARKLLCDQGYPVAKHFAAAVDISQNLRIYYYDGTLTVSFHGEMVYTGHDDTGPWFKDEELREQTHAALIVLRRYMLLEDLANV